jgi:hypothetical protein
MKYAIYIAIVFSFISTCFANDEATNLVTMEKNWNAIVLQYVHSGNTENIKTTLVNYKDLKTDKKFKQLISSLRNFDITKLHSKEEKLSFWINSYNIAAIKLITENYGVNSIKDIGSLFSPVWKKEAIIIGQKSYSLNDIEHEILRKLGDPRMHFAIVCASLSCPDLKPYAYATSKIDEQLELSSKAFLQNNGKGLVFSRDSKVIYVSKILKWFEDDFDKNGGVKSFISKHVDKDVSNFEIRYLDYNWGLNAK